MFKYIDLCVDMKQGRKCKDALINYRNTCQQVNVGSLEDVIKYLLKVATDKAQDAQKAAQVGAGAVQVQVWPLWVAVGVVVGVIRQCVRGLSGRRHVCVSRRGRENGGREGESR